MLSMNFKPTKQINFIKQSKYAFVASVLLIIGSFVSLYMKGLDYGIDFLGGILVEVQSEEQIDMAEMRHKVGQLGLGETNLQSDVVACVGGYV